MLRKTQAVVPASYMYHLATGYDYCLEECPHKDNCTLVELLEGSIVVYTDMLGGEVDGEYAGDDVDDVDWCYNHTLNTCDFVLYIHVERLQNLDIDRNLGTCCSAERR